MDVLRCTIYWWLDLSLMIMGPAWSDVIPIMHVHMHAWNTLVIRDTKCRHIHTPWSWDLVEPSWIAWAWAWLGPDWGDPISRATCKNKWICCKDAPMPLIWLLNVWDYKSSHTQLMLIKSNTSKMCCIILNVVIAWLGWRCLLQTLCCGMYWSL